MERFFVVLPRIELHLYLECARCSQLQGITTTRFLHNFLENAVALRRGTRNKRKPNIVAIVASIIVRDLRIRAYHPRGCLNVVGTAFYCQRAQTRHISQLVRGKRRANAANFLLRVQMLQRLTHLLGRQSKLVSQRFKRTRRKRKMRLNTRKHQLFLTFFRRIGTVGLFLHVIAIQTKRPRATTATHTFILARSTFTLQALVMAQILEHRRVRPNFRERNFCYVPQVHVEITAGLHLSNVADERERDAAQTPARHGFHAVGCGAYFYALSCGLLTQNAIILRRIGRLEMHRRALLALECPTQHFFVFIRRKLNIKQIGTSTRGHKQKRMKRNRAIIQR